MNTEYIEKQYTFKPSHTHSLVCGLLLSSLPGAAFADSLQSQYNDLVVTSSRYDVTPYINPLSSGKPPYTQLAGSSPLLQQRTQLSLLLPMAVIPKFLITTL